MQESEISSLREENKKVKPLQRELDKLKYESADDKSLYMSWIRKARQKPLKTVLRT